MSKKISFEDIASMMEKGFGAVVEDISSIRERMATMAAKEDLERFATKEDLARMATNGDIRQIVREETRDIRQEVHSIRKDLEHLDTKVDNIVGLPKEIDHALERIAAIEKHLGINKRIAA